MNLIVYDQNMKKVAFIGGQFDSCLWKEGYNTLGSFALGMPETPGMKTVLRPDYYVRRQDRKTLMVIKTVRIKQRMITVEGVGAQRVLDDVAFVGTLKAGFGVVDGLRIVYNKSRKFPHVTIVESDVPDKFDRQVSNKSVLEIAEIMCAEKDVGIRAVKLSDSAPDQIGIELYKPVPGPAIKFSSMLGNLGDPELTLSTSKYRNVAIVLGQGEESTRVREEVDLSKGGVRREMVVDARDLQQDVEGGETLEAYKARLHARGAEKLLEQQKTWTCKLTPLGAEFGQRYDLGDMVTVLLLDHGLKLSARITAFTQKEQRNKVTTTVDVGSLTVIKR